MKKVHIVQKENLLSNLRTIEDRTLLQGELTSLLESLYRTNGATFQETLQNDIRLNLANFLRQELGIPGKSPGKAVIEQAIKNLNTIVSKLPTISLDIPIDPTLDTVTIISEWVRDNIHPQMLLDMHVDRSMIAGIRITHNGRYREINFGNLITQTLQQKSQYIRSLLQ
jgi:hypothetical protein